MFRLLSLIIILELFAAPALPALAISIPSASQIASELEQRYNLNLPAIQEQGQLFNVADQKKITPEVSIFFSPSDPKVGEKLTAIALPIYFSNEGEGLYYTWYLKHRICNLKGGGLSAAERATCDKDNNNRITVEDWKIEAMRILASNNFTGPATPGNDNDGYKARLGGDSKAGMNNYCYFHDNVSGENYEIINNTSGSSASAVTFPCNAGLQPVCMEATQTVGATPTNPGDTWAEGTGNLVVSGTPFCASGGLADCNLGAPCCVADPLTATTCEQAINTCTTSTIITANPSCQHLFPNAPGQTTGDGTFGAGEESFWQTDPGDPDTADNGNKDEANVAGLGRDRFSWNYDDGDQVGVVVEGTAIIPTKHDDSSTMIMWAFSRNDCPASGSTGSYSQFIRGYSVLFKTIGIDLNGCLERNLVDPTMGGQATNLEVSVKANPENPINDGVGEDGDIIEAAATVDNSSKSLLDTFFDWRVEISPTGVANPGAPWVNITNSLNTLSGGRKLLSPVRGNSVNTVRLKLNLKNTDVLGGQAFSNYLNNGIGYLRFRVDVRENFSSGANRKGNGSVVVKFQSAGDKIRAYIVSVNGNPARVSLTPQEICSGVVTATDPLDKQALDKLEAKLCRVIENEIIGLSVDNTSGAYSNFNWTINGKPLICNTKVSPSCVDNQQGSINFFPVVGNPGDTVTIGLTANKIDFASSTEKTVTISRVFKIVTPSVEIVTNDSTTAWPKVLGQYIDANGKTFIDTSKNTLEALAGSAISLRANFIPTFLEIMAPPRVERAWTIDDIPIGDATSGTVRAIAPVINKPVVFTTSKPEGSIYNVNLSAAYRPDVLIRKALSDIWGISVLDSTEQYFGTTVQLEHPPGDYFVKGSGPQKYLALLSSYLPSSLLLALRVLLSIALILFVSGVVLALLPREPAPTRRF